ncbi:hypothetical protein [uncultured Chryseobacterium sp.]|uniref:GH39 family glycosyl hydrolase n=1 Tax=uncultured Chryseobacterium sp. TaxID=259322 RepID=UPI0025EA8730|nr:hypothetical protein [uncultured Chryseobacterium sp.]
MNIEIKSLNDFFKEKSLKIIEFFILILVLFYFLVPQFVYSQQTISVDFSKKLQKKESIAGFLHFNDLTPLDKNIRMLKPKYWRVGNALHDKTKRVQQIKLLHSYHITPILVLTDFFAGTEDNWGKPFLKQQKFRDLVKNLYLENGNEVIYDLWNEPDTDSWGGSEEQFFQTFKIAHDVIRSLPGGKNAVITGPGTSRFNEDFLRNFLKYCNSNNVRVDILNWHEGGILKDVMNVQTNIRTAERWIKEFPKVGIKRIFIPEILWHTEQFNPAAVFAYLYVIEKNGASGACKTCWDTPAEFGGNTCWNNSMDGILDPQGNTRSVWWAYKFYADSLDKRLTSSSDESIMNIPYLDSDNNFSMIITNISHVDLTKLVIDLKNMNSGIINRNGNQTLKLYEITNTDEKPLKSPKLLFEIPFSMKSNNKKINLENIAHNKMYYLQVSKRK